MSNRDLYTDDLAERLKPLAGQKWRPSNGTEGEIFSERWCAGCRRDAAFRADEGDSCPIICNAMAFDTGHPDYPAAWQYGPDGQPICAEFDDLSRDAAAERCPATTDLFA